MLAGQGFIELLSKLVFAGSDEAFQRPAEQVGPLRSEMQQLAALSPAEWNEFVKLADSHHVTIRSLAVLEKAAVAHSYSELAGKCRAVLNTERTRIRHAITKLKSVCEALESQGCPLVVIKSLDHWPDLGSDLDLYTTIAEGCVQKLMAKKLDAAPVERSWGDRLANKWNFKVPGLPELVEIHVRYLGQTGEHKRLARRVVTRRVEKILDGMSFYVPAPEERIMISTLQRMYRHFYFRLCDMLDVAALLHARAVDFQELKQTAQEGGIWPGVAAFLLLVAKYVESYGRRVEIPRAILAAAPKCDMWFENGFLRVSKISAAGLYGAQLLNAGLRHDLRAFFRLPLLPPLAISALLAYRLTGSDKGVW